MLFHLAAEYGKVNVAQAVYDHMVTLQQQLRASPELCADSRSLSSLANSPLALVINAGNNSGTADLPYRNAAMTHNLQQVVDNLACAQTGPHCCAHQHRHDRQHAHIRQCMAVQFSMGDIHLDCNPKILLDLPAGQTPLHVACARGHSGMALWLLEHGANPWVRYGR